MGQGGSATSSTGLPRRASASGRSFPWDPRALTARRTGCPRITPAIRRSSILGCRMRSAAHRTGVSRRLRRVAAGFRAVYRAHSRLMPGRRSGSGRCRCATVSRWRWPAPALISPGNARASSASSTLSRSSGRALREHAHSRGVRLFGDLPFYVAPSSAEVWAHRRLFQLTASGAPAAVAGVPPDYFAALGQLWGNPLYDWQAIERCDFRWWLARVGAQLERLDLLRLDHFRALSAHWAVPATAPDARSGAWHSTPGEALLKRLARELGELPLVAEDLGVITPDVVALQRAFALPGMRVLQFAFDGDPNNTHLPHMHRRDSVVYTGTHDNDTTLGWYAGLDRDTAARVGLLLGVGEHPGDVAGAVLRAALWLARAPRHPAGRRTCWAWGPRRASTPRARRTATGAGACRTARSARNSPATTHVSTAVSAAAEVLRSPARHAQTSSENSEPDLSWLLVARRLRARARTLQTPRLSRRPTCSVLSSELWEQRLKVRLRVQNPNDSGTRGAGHRVHPRHRRPAGGEWRLGRRLCGAGTRRGAVRHHPHDQHGRRTAAAHRPRSRYARRWRSTTTSRAGVSLANGWMRSVPFDERGSFKLQ